MIGSPILGNHLNMLDTHSPTRNSNFWRELAVNSVFFGISSDFNGMLIGLQRDFNGISWSRRFMVAKLKHRTWYTKGYGRYNYSSWGCKYP